jgi:membrane protein YqaA with SNARE-associated domain
VTADFALHAALFASAFISATIFPGQSEVLLVGLLAAGHPPLALLIVASIGNVLGSVCSWGMGRGIETFRDRRWFPVKPEALERAKQWFARYGKWALLLSWAPVIGDPITLLAGVLRVPLLQFVLLVAVAKTARYVVLALLAMHFLR